MIGLRNLAPQRGPSVWGRPRRWRIDGRWVSGIGGGVMAAAGTAVAIVGAAMVARAMKGARPTAEAYPSAADLVGRESAASFPASDAPSWTPTTGVGGAARPVWETRDVLGGPGGLHVEHEVVIARPVEQVYRFWRHLPNLPRFMHHLQSVTASTDGRRSHWVARAPLGSTVQWDAEVVNEVPDQVIGWRSLEGSDVVSAGSVTFKPTADGTGTTLRVKLQYEPPAGRLGAAVAGLLGEAPARQIADDLGELKRMLEAAPGFLADRGR
jgi:uncharacterized membrane protein